MAALLNGPISAQPPDPPLAPDTLAADPAQDTYLDQTARDLILGAIAVRDSAISSLDSYAAVIRERLRIGAFALRRNQLWMSSDREFRVRWQSGDDAAEAPEAPGAATVEPLSATFRDAGLDRDRLPAFLADPQAEYLADGIHGPPVLFGFGPRAMAAVAAPDIPVRSPLAPGADRHYQFRSADTTSVQLAPGRAIKAVAVTAVPRYQSLRLVAAILWIDPATKRIVRAAYRSSKKVNRETSGRLRWDRGWSPRVWIDPGAKPEPDSAATDNSAASRPGFVGSAINLGANRVAGRVEFDFPAVVVDFAPDDGAFWLPRKVRWTGYVAWENVTATGYVAPGLPIDAEWDVAVEHVAPGGAAASADAPSAQPPASPLPPPPLGDIAAALDRIGTGEGGDRADAASPWFFFPPLITVGLMRYNPVEGFATGGQLRRDFGWWRSALTFRISTRSLAVPDLDFTMQRDHPSRRVQMSVYRALRTGPLGVGGVDGYPSYLVPASDSAAFFWSRGAAIRLIPGNGGRANFEAAVFAERDADIGIGADARSGAERDRFGTELIWRPWWGGPDDGSVGFGGAAAVRGSMGDNPHVRAILEAAMVIPLPGRLTLGVQGASARVWGDPAPQDLWRPASANGRWLRGHGDVSAASKMWMARIDLQRALGPVRLSVFGDWASVNGGDHCAVGAGIVFMQGFLRLDAARGLPCGTGGPTTGGWVVQPGGLAYF